MFTFTYTEIRVYRLSPSSLFGSCVCTEIMSVWIHWRLFVFVLLFIMHLTGEGVCLCVMDCMCVVLLLLCFVSLFRYGMFEWRYYARAHPHFTETEENSQTKENQFPCWIVWYWFTRPMTLDVYSRNEREFFFRKSLESCKRKQFPVRSR